MKQSMAERYTLAWFKLAECVSRGEKERALGVYRLLSHSLNDQAFSRHLEGDIFLSFQEIASAQQRYKDAAILYQKEGRLLESAAVYEQLITLEAEDHESRIALLMAYHQLGPSERYKKQLHQAIDLLSLSENDPLSLQKFLVKLEQHDARVYQDAQDYLGKRA